jgi:SAM-dependent methyltransferase
MKAPAITPPVTSAIERQRSHFNAIAQRYEAGREEANHCRIKSLIWRDALACLAPLRGRAVRMLEPMCGYGEGLGIVREHTDLDIDYAGFDYSDVIVEELSRSFSGGRIWQADVTRYRPDSAAYDLIFLAGGLHHVPDNATQVVANLASGLKPGGMFVNFEPTHGNPLFQAVRDRVYARNEIFDEVTERAFPVADLRAMFRGAGLEEVRTFYPGLLAYVMYYNPYAFPLLNKGGTRWVDRLFALDRLVMNTPIGRWLSFATVTIWRKPA